MRPATTAARGEASVARVTPFFAGLLVAILLASVIQPATAGASPEGDVVLEVTRREVVAAGQSFGRVGPYEKIVGRAHIEVDPEHPGNSHIQDIDKVEVNDRGNVEISTDVYILKPVDMARGNGKIFYEVNNRGNKISLPLMNDTPPTADGNDPTTAEDFGNGFLLREGYTLVWSGWQADVVPGNDRLTIDVPVATDDGEPITGEIAVQYDVSRHIPTDGTVSLPLSGRAAFDPYPTASLDTATATLTAHPDAHTLGTEIPSDRWAFATCERDPDTGEVTAVTPSEKHICYFDGFDPEQLYQLVYTAKDPMPMALGHAATRDVISFLRHEPVDGAGTPNPLGSDVEAVLCQGISSSGMYVRDFVYLGFNADTAGRRVCDGLNAHIPGAFRLHLNTRFTMPDIYSRQDLWAGLWPMATFPFGYGVTTDAVTGRTDGILKRPDTDPVVMQTDTSTEYWQFHASLVTTDEDGESVALPDDVRYYLLSSAQHFARVGTEPSRGICQELSNPTHPGVFMRALFVALDDWATEGTPPPASQYPRLEDGTLTTSDMDATGFPAIPGVTYTGKLNTLELRDYGPQFGPEGGIITTMPPEVVGPGYDVLVPAVDADGHDVAGLRRPDDVETPLATHTGWNHRAAGFRENDLCALTGSLVPLPETREERLATGDPRLSVEERYPTRGHYVRSVRDASAALKEGGYLLQEDFRRIVSEAARRDLPRP